MARNMTFSATLKLQAEEFKKGIKQVQSSINGLWKSFRGFAASLGAGIGFTQLTRSIMDTATKLSVAKNTLDNVSKGYKEYGESIVWLREISNKYGQDMTVLINQFAQFRAAAADSGLKIDTLRNIYESLTRAAGAYHMSAERTQDMMIAITQMFSKGKVAAEELRRQLGNSLPGAFNLMAKAAQMAGITTNDTTAELEKAMRDGKVLAKDVLPAFASILNETTRVANFDSLQTSLNRLKNTWANFVDKGEFEGKFKWLIDAANNTLKAIGNNFKTWRIGIISGLAGILGGSKGGSLVKSGEEIIDELAHKWDTLNDRAKRYSKTLKELETKTRDKGLATHVFSDKQANQFLNAYKKLQDTEKELNKVGEKLGFDAVKTQRGRKEVFALNEAAAQLAKSSGKSVYQIESDFGFLTKAEKEAAKEAKVLVKDFGLLKKAGFALGNAFKTIGAAFKTAFSSIAIGAIIAGITTIIQMIFRAIHEARELKNYTKNMFKDINERAMSNPSDDLINLTMYRDALETIKKEAKDTTEPLKGHDKLISNINKTLGLVGDKQFTIESSIDDIILKCNDWIAQLKRVAYQQAAINVLKEKYARQIEIESRLGEIRNDPNYGKTKGRTYSNQTGAKEPIEKYTGAAFKLYTEETKLTKELDAVNKGIDALTGNTKSADFIGPVRSVININDLTEDGPKDIPERTKFEKILDDYKESEKKLQNQLSNGAITQEEYAKSIDDVREKAYKAISEFGNFDNIKLGASDRATVNELKTSFGEIFAKNTLNEQAKELYTEIEKGAEDAVRELETETENAIKAFEKYMAASIALTDAELKELKKRDSKYDYMFSSNAEKGKTYSELYIEQIKGKLELDLDNQTEWENVRQTIKETLSDTAITEELRANLVNALDYAGKKIKEFKNKAEEGQHIINLAELEDDIATVKQDLKEARWDSINDVANSMERLVSSFKSWRDIMEDTDTSGFEKFVSILSLIMQMVDSITSSIKGFSTAIQLAGKLTELMGRKQIAQNALIAASEKAKASEEAKAAVAGAASSTAAIPVVGPAMAAASIGEIVYAIMKGAGMFAKGGMVDYGSSSGDKTLARVNKGEMILNRSQQATLFSAINSGNLGGGGEWKVRGTDLIRVIDNTRMKGRG